MTSSRIGDAIGVAVCALVMLILHMATTYWWWIIAVPLVYGFLVAHVSANAWRTGAVSAGLFPIGAHIGKLGDIGAGGKRLLTGAPQNHAAQIGVFRQRRHHPAQFGPGIEADGVQLRRIVEDHGGDGAVDGVQHG